jgi:hypothetical protein
MSRLRTRLRLTRVARYCTLLAATIALMIGAALVTTSTVNAPAAQAKPINPNVPCADWQIMHPGWPCWGNFPEIEEPGIPGAPGQQPPTVPTPQPTVPGLPETSTAPAPPAAALTPPPPIPALDPCNAIIAVPGYIPPALPGNAPNAPCSYGGEPTPPVQDIGLCPLGRNPDGSCRGHGVLNGSGSLVEIPEDYLYDPDCETLAEGEPCAPWKYMHDYCSGSPDVRGHEKVPTGGQL